MEFVITYAETETGNPYRSATLDAVDLDVAAQRAVANCGDTEFVVRVEQAGAIIDAETDLELIPEPGFIPLGYQVGSAHLAHNRKLYLIAAGSSIYFRLSDRHAYAKLDLNPLARRAAVLLTEERGS